MKSLIRFFFAFILCSSSFSAFPQRKIDPFKYSFLRENKITNPAARGYWQSIGRGYLLEIRADSVLLYSFTQSFTYKEKNDYLEGLYNAESRFERIGDTLRILPADFGERSHLLQITNDFVRIDKLPENVISFSQMQQLGPPKLFDLFIETLKENYAFSIERKMNWDSIRSLYTKQITDTQTDSALFEKFGEIVTLTKDHHTKIINKSGRTLQFRGTGSAEIVSKAFRDQSEVKDQNDYFNLFFKKNYQHITDSLLSGKGRKLANGQIEYGDLTENVGYIHINSFTGFAPAGFTRKQQIDSINGAMEQIINSFSRKKSIVIDISFNFGGYDAAAIFIAGFFTTKPAFAYTSQVYNNGSFYNESPVYVSPSGKKAFTKPVYVLMTDITRSAAEGFAMMMNSLPHVTLVGTNTMGILSGMLGKSIGDFYSTSSFQRLMDMENKYYEVTGVIPDFYKTIFNAENILSSHMISVKELADKIEKGDKF